jgi:PHP family Zn ribbon phosphoesterase
VLLKTDLREIEKLSGTRVSEAIAKVRKGDIYIEPGYDGVFGKVRIWTTTLEASKSKQAIDQEALF